MFALSRVTRCKETSLSDDSMRLVVWVLTLGLALPLARLAACGALPPATL